MKKTLDGIPRYSSENTQVPAELFNLVRLALLRLGSPLRFAIPELRNIEVVLDEETWICLDSSLNDIPVLAWTEFNSEHRDSLVEPIDCSYFTYHAHADKIEDRIVEHISQHLDRLLHDDSEKGE